MVNILSFILLNTFMCQFTIRGNSHEVAKPACFLYFLRRLKELEPSDEQLARINKQVEDGWRDPLERAIMIEKAKDYSRWTNADIYRIAKMFGYQGNFILA